MAAVSNVSSTGNIYIDSLLSGEKWSSSTLTFSFPASGSSYEANYGQLEPSKNFRAFDETQQTAVRAVLGDYAGALKASFSELTGGAAQTATLRYGESDQVATAWAYTPVASSEGGDVWLSASSRAYDTPTRGGYAWMTLVHETGHTLGLKHAQEAEGGNGVMPTDHDSVEYTVMSYRSYAGASLSRGYVNGTWDYPQTLMLDDIRALQHMYGANFSRAGSDLVYRWSPTTGELSINGVGQGQPGGNKVFMTVWTGGANATYDFSAYTNDLKVDLRPGHWSTISTAQLARLDGRTTDTHLAAGNIANAYYATDGGNNNLVRNVFGGAGADTILGNDADNKIRGGAGADQIDGGAGVNTAVYLGASADYQWKATDAKTWTVSDLRAGSPDGTDTLTNIAFLQFSDRTVSLGAASGQLPAAPAAVVTAPPAPTSTTASPAPTASPTTTTSTTASVVATTLNLQGAYEKILGVAGDTPTVVKLATQVEAKEISVQTALEAIFTTAHATTSVALLTYQFFTGATPTQDGMNYILSSPANEANLNSAYYAEFSVEERYINFSVNLGKLGEGRQGFEGRYGSLSMADAAGQAYKTIMGVEAKSDDIAHILGDTISYDGLTTTREVYFQTYGGDDLGAKAAMVGWMLSEAVRTDAGLYAHANDAFLADLADGATYNVDLIGVYGHTIG